MVVCFGFIPVHRAVFAKGLLKIALPQFVKVNPPKDVCAKQAVVKIEVKKIVPQSLTYFHKQMCIDYFPFEDMVDIASACAD